MKRMERNINSVLIFGQTLSRPAYVGFSEWNDRAPWCFFKIDAYPDRVELDDQTVLRPPTMETSQWLSFWDTKQLHVTNRRAEDAWRKAYRR